MTRLARLWDEYWFRPARIVDLGVFRIAVVGSQLILFYPSLKAQLSLFNEPAEFYRPLPLFKVLFAPFGIWGLRPSVAFITIVWIVGIVFGVLALLGVFARISLAGFALASTILIAHLYSYGEVHHQEAVIVVALWMLALAPSGASMSLTRLRKRIRDARAEMRFVPHHIASESRPNTSEFALWPLRVVQWFLCLIYLSAAISKIKYGGMAWLDASTLRYYLIEDGTNGRVPLGLMTASYPGLLPVLALFTVAYELTFVLVMFMPVLVWLYIPLGILMHTGVFMMQRVTFFQFMFGYVAFIETMRRTWPTARRTLWRILKHPPMSPATTDWWTLVYDGFCPLCIRTMVVIDAVDLTHQLRYIDFEQNWPEVAVRAPGLAIAEAREAIHLISRTGRIYRGYYGFKRLARQLPVLWPISIVLAIPGVDRLGVRVYDEVARRRAHTVCSPESCAVPVR